MNSHNHLSESLYDEDENCGRIFINITNFEKYFSLYLKILKN